MPTGEAVSEACPFLSFVGCCVSVCFAVLLRVMVCLVSVPALAFGTKAGGCATPRDGCAWMPLVAGWSHGQLPPLFRAFGTLLGLSSTPWLGLTFALQIWLSLVSLGMFLLVTTVRPLSPRGPFVTGLWSLPLPLLWGLVGITCPCRICLWCGIWFICPVLSGLVWQVPMGSCSHLPVVV